MSSSTLIVLSHLRWDGVFRRPQHLLTRLAQHHRVLFIEEPVRGDCAPRLECLADAHGINVLRPHIDADDAPLGAAQPLLERFMREEAIDEPLVWFDTPAALPLLRALKPRAVIYDCVDEPPVSGLLEAADLVLAGGPGLLRAQRARHGNVHWLPSAADAAHFAPHRITANCKEYLAAERLQGHILAPRLGFYGAIDQRLDLGLLDAVAASRPNWHLVMVGPAVNIDPSALPRRPNLHWLGAQPYSRLPALVAGWDICLLPYALDEHTRFTSPGQTLEYLAAEKPVVGTPLPELCALYGEVVPTAADSAAFIERCAALLEETPQRRAERLAASALCVAHFSWDETAHQVQRLIEEMLEQPVLA